uniref:Transposable element P transposase-like RNase H domain-containing protein n=1 Tax=Amphimedon queenslandica TaxID=400682 RepID=A0A1X7TUN1_AMPQE
MIQADNRSMSLGDNEHEDLLSIMRAHHDLIIDSYPEDSFQRIFWSSQYSMAEKVKSSNGFRLNPALIKWCIYLCHKSSAYELISKGKILHLPSQCTLRQYSNALNSSAGFSNELDEQLLRDMNVPTLQEYQKYVGLLGEEMYIRERFLYDKSTAMLVGYYNMGNINNHLLLLEKEYMEKDMKATIAITMMVLMVRGPFSHFEFPYASFPTGNLSGEQLVPIFYEAILRIERSGLRVATITLDRNSVNRKFSKL